MQALVDVVEEVVRRAPRRVAQVILVQHHNGGHVGDGVPGQPGDRRREEHVARHRGEGGVGGEDDGDDRGQVAARELVGLHDQHGAPLGRSTVLRLVEVHPNGISRGGSPVVFAGESQAPGRDRRLRGLIGPGHPGQCLIDLLGEGRAVQLVELAPPGHHEERGTAHPELVSTSRRLVERVVRDGDDCLHRRSIAWSYSGIKRSPADLDATPDLLDVRIPTTSDAAACRIGPSRWDY